MTKFYDAVYSFERVGGLSIRKALHINVWEKAWVTAMAAGGEQTRSAHGRDVSLGARIRCHISYPTDSLNASRLGLWSSLGQLRIGGFT